MKPQPSQPHLWTAAERMLKGLMHFIGVLSAGAIAQLSRRERGALIDWLVRLETMVRRLIFIEAEALYKERQERQERGSSDPHLSATPELKRGSEDPRSLCAPRPPAFMLIPAAARDAVHPARIRDLGAPLLVRDIWREQKRRALIARLLAAPHKSAPNLRLLNRIAALSRAIAKPLTQARRLAKIINKKPRRFARIVAALASRVRRRMSDYFDMRSDEDSRLLLLPLAQALDTG